MNALKGLLQGIHSNGKMSNDELHQLTSWLKEHKNFRKKNGYDGIITILETVVADGKLTDDEFRILMNALERTSFPKINSKDHTAAMLELKEIIEGIRADNKIEEKELIVLGQWMKEHSDLCGNASYETIFSTIVTAMEDDVITQEEHEQLMQAFSRLTHAEKRRDHNPDPNGKTFYLSGIFERQHFRNQEKNSYDERGSYGSSDQKNRLYRNR